MNYNCNDADDDGIRLETDIETICSDEPNYDIFTASQKKISLLQQQKQTKY